jgi:hypothetical protein
MRKLAGLSILSFLASCATTAPYNIDFEATSSTLFIEAPDGSLTPPLAGQIVDVDSIGFGREAIRLVPGKHFIRHDCPTLPPGILAAADWAPSIEYDFEVGHKYVLRCKDGGLVIDPLDD